jgi:hypothetical protein
VRLGYNNAETFLVYTLDNYLDLDDEQQQRAREGIRALRDWHRQTQLTEYVQWLDGTHAKLDGAVEPAQVLAFTLGFNERLAAIGEHATPSLAAIVLTLRPEQIARLEKKLAQNLAKDRREITRHTGADAIGERTKRYAERAEEWFGSLSGDQHGLIRNSLALRSGGDLWWLEERAQRHRDLIAVLRRVQQEQPGQATVERWARDYLRSLREPTDPVRRERLQAWRIGNAELVAQLINSAHAGQKRHLLKKLRGYSEDFSALAAENGRGPPG